jgi:hypothetical protein
METEKQDKRANYSRTTCKGLEAVCTGFHKLQVHAACTIHCAMCRGAGEARPSNLATLVRGKMQTLAQSGRQRGLSAPRTVCFGGPEAFCSPAKRHPRVLTRFCAAQPSVAAILLSPSPLTLPVQTWTSHFPLRVRHTKVPDPGRIQQR